MTMSKTPKKELKQMAQIYEKCWNDVVSNMAPWRRKIITENFEIIDGRHVYPNRKDHEIADAAAHEASKKADRIIYDTFTGKYK